MVDGDTFHLGYVTDWLFVRPEEFAATHHPREPAWELRGEPDADEVFASRADLAGVVLIAPPTGRARTDGPSVEVTLGARPGLAVEVRRQGAEDARSCPLDGDPVIARCPLSDGPGAYAVDVLRVGGLAGVVAVDRTR